jgi:hypothetical protein
MIELLNVTLAAAVTGALGDEKGIISQSGLPQPQSVGLSLQFTRAAGGTTCKVWVQSSFDGGATWHDVVFGDYTTTTKTQVYRIPIHEKVSTAETPTDGTLASEGIKPGLIGSLLRVKYTTTGTYSGASSLKVYAEVQ